MVGLGLFFGVLCVVLLVLWARFAYCDVPLLYAQLVRRKDPNFFEGKVIWITGASQGLGQLLAQTLVEKGAKLILSSRSTEKLRNVAEFCSSPGRIHILPFDLRNANWDEIAASAHSSFPEGIDYVIHNAGMSQHSAASETRSHVVDDVFRLNAIGPIALTQALLPGMLKRGKGHFVVISSMAGKIPSPGQAIYASSKFALMGYFHSLRTELAATALGVTICCPGPFKFPNQTTTREVYHNAGVVREQMTRSSGTFECWMAKQPVLFLAYLIQYIPGLAHLLLNRIGPKRAADIRSGNSYSMTKMLSSDKSN